MSEVTATKEDLQVLSEAYWDMTRQGGDKEYEAQSLSRIYYTCEDVIRNAAVTDNAVAFKCEADLTVGDTITP